VQRNLVLSEGVHEKLYVKNHVPHLIHFPFHRGSPLLILNGKFDVTLRFGSLTIFYRYSSF